MNINKPCVCWTTTIAHIHIESLRQSSSEIPKIGAGFTPLHWAVWAGSLRIVNWLLSHGAEIDIQDAHGDTPLLLGLTKSTSSQREIVHTLIANGASTQIKNEDGANAKEVSYTTRYPFQYNFEDNIM